MNGAADWSKVLLPNGVGRTPGGSADDPIDRQVADAMTDLVICVRGQTPNRALGYADRFMFVGEWGLALEEIVATLEGEPEIEIGDWSAAALLRARTLMSLEQE
ncbi:hypothetical protein [Jannaschia donghaensis]|uniref:Uncharacterized protein n=1 Tax=Jannaschia donghaensis TaxID=420998 RepID=A0A0M6YFR8_9RHOB|nr:hypothetical protein [Jannaschia donghaensis]CTQ48774.1 hypothetical protein JDO7802_00779 [Jannaschia donghaensis]